ncbi:MAG: hypothetical protein RO009_18750 [Pseudorhodoplanes sp.]|jgi:hypothetical protein|nr:hypothetical protein [Pseudorhodoplanes sp.]
MSRTSRAPRKAQRPEINAIPAVRFLGEHRYFAETGHLITSGVVEVCGVIGMPGAPAPSECFVCDGRLRHIYERPCKSRGCRCLTCQVHDVGSDDIDAILLARKRCGCINCTRRRARSK